MKRLSVLCVGLLISCSDSTNDTDGKCSDNAECPAGQVCDSAGDCQVICNSDTQCASGEICEGDVCIVGTRSTAPEIAAIRGNVSAFPDTQFSGCAVSYSRRPVLSGPLETDRPVATRFASGSRARSVMDNA